ncbi:MAG: GNAT family N-acetyltransferase [Candidatus Micrarchaeaceae archaeon]
MLLITMPNAEKHNAKMPPKMSSLLTLQRQHDVNFSAAEEQDVPAIVKMINTEAKSGTVLHVDEQEVMGWVKSGLSFVAKAEADGSIVGHYAAYVWPQSGWAELRSAVVTEGFRGNGIHAKLHEKLMNVLQDEYTIAVLKTPESRGHTILDSDSRFTPADPSIVPPELFSIGPKGEKWDVYISVPTATDDMKKRARA